MTPEAITCMDAFTVQLILSKSLFSEKIIHHTIGMMDKVEAFHIESTPTQTSPNSTYHNHVLTLKMQHQSSLGLDTFIHTFLNELLFQTLHADYQSVYNKTKELIAGRALYSALHPIEESDRWTDPSMQSITQDIKQALEQSIPELEDIAKPWEEKYGKE